MELKEYGRTLLNGLLILFVIFWIYHIIECLRRRDYGLFDRIFWFLVLLVPVLGLILYRGIGNEFYKDKSGRKN